MLNFKVFGTRPQEGIFLPHVLFNLRNDLKVGNQKVGEDDYQGKEIEISILKDYNNILKHWDIFMQRLVGVNLG